MGHLMDRVVVVCDVRVIILGKKLRELLIHRTAGVESGDSVDHYLQPGQASASLEKDVDLLVIDASLDSWSCQGPS